ncbi:alpha/beta fold hydrolase [Actinoplanes aureus]|uniref:Alpha/beta fold hydrolase n=1 Tax=Actinoplanes aureus TaxID=2792083 RepID=A0A931CJ53_9ACTN|nr:alpha/beta fold hydrolase [Actinoplanes aureus]MBG0567356.1 alpha/beta fold hydrolase [Actinoplanes aureus]
MRQLRRAATGRPARGRPHERVIPKGFAVNHAAAGVLVGVFPTRTARMSPAQRRLTRAAPGPAEGFTSATATVRGADLHVRQRVDSNAAAPIWVLLHGLAVSHRYLMPTAAALPGSVFVPDLPGFGLSGTPARVLTTEQHAEVVAAWMDAVGLAGAHVLGNSFGCQIAVELAIRRPDLVASLTLVGPTVDPAAPTAFAQIRRWAHDLLSEDPHQLPMILTDFRDAGPRRVLRTLGYAVGHHIERRIPLVEAPILILRGQYDPIAPADWTAHATSLARRGSTGDLPGAAHNAVTTTGALVAELAAAFALTLTAGHGRSIAHASQRAVEVPLDERRMPVEHTTSAAEARHVAEQFLHDWNMTDRTDDVLLVTTELIQNLTQHTDDGGELHLRLRDDAILIEVTDTNPQPPHVRPLSPAVPGGRGLLLVAATARRWGSRPAGWAGRTGKVVWAEIARRLPR